MQSQSLHISLTSTKNLSTQPYPSGTIQLHQMPVQTLIKTFVLAMESVPLQVRYQLTKLSVLGLFQAIKLGLSQSDHLASEASPKKDQAHFQKILSPQDHSQIEFKEDRPVTQQIIFDHLIFASGGQQFLGKLCFDKILLSNPEHMMRLLTSDVQNKDRLLMQEAITSSHQYDSIDVLFRKCKDITDIQRLMMPFLRGCLLLQLKTLLFDKDKLNGKIESQRNCQKQQYFYWKGLTHQHKLQILLLGCKDLEGLLQHLGQQGISLSLKQLQQSIKIMLDIDSSSMLTSFFSVPFHQINHPSAHYRRIVYRYFQRQIQSNKQSKIGKTIRQDRDFTSEQKMSKDLTQKRKRKGKKKSMRSESNQTNYTQDQPKIIDKNIYFSQQLLLQKPKLLTETKGEHRHEKSQEEKRQPRQLTYSTEREGRSTRPPKSKIRAGKIKKSKEQKIKETMECLQKGQLGNPQVLVEPSKLTYINYSRTLDKAQSKDHPKEAREQGRPLWKEQTTKATFSKLAEELSEMSDNISEQANLYYQRRIIAFSRIQFLLSHYSIPIKLFGSCANGIAVKNSDIDIAIDQSILYWMEFVPQNEKVVAALERVEELFRAYPCFQELKLIKTAAIPVIKLAIDTSVLFISPQYKQFNRAHNAGLIYADITIQTINQDNQSSHLGIRTTQVISKWLKKIKCLHSIVIVMKQFFAVSKLNLAYQGGLNTISMIVMIVAFIIHAGLQDQENEALVLEKILRFYSTQFDEKTTGIDLMKQLGNSIFYRKSNYPSDHPQLMKAELQIRDPLCQGKNMTRNCYLFPKIKQMLKKILQQCFDRRLRDMETAVSGQTEVGRELLSQITGSSSQINFGNAFLKLHSQMCKPI